MSTIVWQHGVQPCIESSHVVEATTMQLKLVAQPKCYKEKPHNGDFGGWSFVQSFSSSKPNKESSNYVHPWADKTNSLWKLSPKSLELCTESLGSETGSDQGSLFSFLMAPTPSMDTWNDIKPAPMELVERNLFPHMGSTPAPSGDESTGNERKPAHKELVERTLISYEGSTPATSGDTGNERKPAPGELAERNPVPQMGSKKVASRGFPPPLTTITSPNLLRVRPYREGGRLIIQAVETPLANSCFQAERSHGRLRLTCWRSTDNDLDSQREENDNLELENDSIHADNAQDNKDEEEEIQMEKQKFQRPSTCKEDGQGDKRLCSNWEPFWLATS